MRKLLIYPGNYNPLFEFENYMHNYQTYFTKDYNTISEVANIVIEKFIAIISSALVEWYSEIPEDLSDELVTRAVTN
jgi:hypothetical protein